MLDRIVESTRLRRADARISGGGIEFTAIPVVDRDYRYDPKNPRATAVQVDPAAVKAFAAGLIGRPPPRPHPHPQPHPPGKPSTS